MKGPEIVIWSVIALWLIIAAVVIGYPLIAGRMRVGLDSVSREDDPRAFWNAYVFSTTLFVGVSIAAGLFPSKAILGFAWYDEAQWQLLAGVVPDRSELCETFQDWEAGAVAAVRKIEAQGKTVERVPVDGLCEGRPARTTPGSARGRSRVSSPDLCRTRRVKDGLVARFLGAIPARIEALRLPPPMLTRRHADDADLVSRRSARLVAAG